MQFKSVHGWSKSVYLGNTLHISANTEEEEPVENVQNLYVR